jgi:FHA domain
MIKCSECGYENIDGLDYCDGCGAKLAPVAPAELPTGTAPSAGTAPSSASTAPTAAEPTVPEGSASEIAPPVVQAGDGGAKTSISSTGGSVVPSENGSSSHDPTGEIKPPEPAPAPAVEKPAAGSHFRAKLSLIRGGRKGQEFPLEEGKNLIGRWDPETGSFPEVDLEQDDPEAKISRKHAMIIIESGHITVEDIGSLNGTYVNRGNRLIPGTPQEVKTGDELIIGKTFLKLVVDPIS